MGGNELDLKEMKEIIKEMRNERSTQGAEDYIVENYKFYEKMRDTMLFTLYELHPTYIFKHNIKLKNREV